MSDSNNDVNWREILAGAAGGALDSMRPDQVFSRSHELLPTDQLPDYAQELWGLAKNKATGEYEGMPDEVRNAYETPAIENATMAKAGALKALGDRTNQAGLAHRSPLKEDEAHEIWMRFQDAAGKAGLQATAQDYQEHRADQRAYAALMNQLLANSKSVTDDETFDREWWEGLLSGGLGGLLSGGGGGIIEQLLGLLAGNKNQQQNQGGGGDLDLISGITALLKGLKGRRDSNGGNILGPEITMDDIIADIVGNPDSQFFTGNWNDGLNFTDAFGDLSFGDGWTPETGDFGFDMDNFMSDLDAWLDDWNPDGGTDLFGPSDNLFDTPSGDIFLDFGDQDWLGTGSTPTFDFGGDLGLGDWMNDTSWDTGPLYDDNPLYW